MSRDVWAVDRLSPATDEKAVELIAERRFGEMVAFTGTQVWSVPLKEATGALRTVPLDGGFVSAARSLGSC